MKHVFVFVTCFFFLTASAWAETSALPESENVPEEVRTKPEDPLKQVMDDSVVKAAKSTKLPLDIVSKGADQSGTLFSYKLKEELTTSKLFELTPLERKKFVLQVRTQPEFPDRPALASQYSIALVYQEDSKTLAYYLDQIQGQVHGDSVAAEIQKVLEWSYATLKRYHYLLED